MFQKVSVDTHKDVELHRGVSKEWLLSYDILKLGSGPATSQLLHNQWS